MNYSHSKMCDLHRLLHCNNFENLSDVESASELIELNNRKKYYTTVILILSVALATLFLTLLITQKTSCESSSSEIPNITTTTEFCIDCNV